MNIHYTLDEHGWSTCWFHDSHHKYEVSITHIFGENPIEVCIHSLMDIISGKKETSFYWYGEPGGEHICIKEIPQNPSKVTLHSFWFKGFGEEEKDREESFRFEIDKIQLVRMFYFEFKKIEQLMRDKDFNQNRNQEFPFQRFKEFEKKALPFIDLDDR